MESSSSSLDRPIVIFPSAPPPESLACCMCGSSSSLKELSLCAEKGCDTCRLRHTGILSFYEQPADRGEEIDVHIIRIYPRGSIMNIVEESRNGDVYGRLHVQLYTRTGQAKSLWPIVGVAREVEDRRRGYAAVVAEWLRTCREKHPACPSNTDVPLPTRLLDVGPPRSNSIRLMRTSGQKGAYIDLSHCWGGGIDIRTTKKTMGNWEKQILDSELPRTFQDAVTVTRDLGLRHLWIDALCIVQDDLEDWEKESGNMATVYSNAYTVEGADKSPDSHTGFLDDAPGGYHGEGKLVAAIDSENSLIYARRVKFHRNPCPIFRVGRREPLSRRAWTMQEQMLASRMVHFAAREMVWECNSALLCECMELGDPDNNGLRQHHKPALQISPRSSGRFKVWYRVVQEVMNRNITEPQDILPCLSGLAQRFQDCGAGTYLAGLWLDDLLLRILWEGAFYCSRVTPYRALSCS